MEWFWSLKWDPEVVEKQVEEISVVFLFFWDLTHVVPAKGITSNTPQRTDA